MKTRDWEEWYQGYDDVSSDLNARLDAVRQAIRTSLPDHIEDTYKILDICAGDGRDLIPVLGVYESRSKVQAMLVELDAKLAARASSSATAVGLENIDVVIGDASNTKIYADILPADLILLCGIFGNISDRDIESLITALPELCKQNGKVIWTRNRRDPDITPHIRELLISNGFSELDFVTTAQNAYAVGINAYKQATAPYIGDRSLFTFIR